MINLLDLVRYILLAYPYPDELSKARLNKMIYLIDWKSAIENSVQITNIKWVYNHYGPYVVNIAEQIKQDKRFEIKETFNSFGSEKHIIRLVNDTGFTELDSKVKAIVDFIIEKTKRLGWGGFIDLVYSTYPIISSEKGEDLNLVELAKEYAPIRIERKKVLNIS
eukprot:TRINITY_DN22683_c0_g1_i1.p1 TRINITY_DN22683_c0_g1~~TRINITY_DN22683_c0_g1_i1.p1  ORF type:complete len:165 (+),score=3.87 TRINITY_DN22683_c0_g1_i1:254-748(+)